jgi:predicted metal-dependent enzyme (double-stranded beta helix superfamily)
MKAIDLDVTQAVRRYVAQCLESPDWTLEKIREGLFAAAWYSPKDRRVLRSLMDAHPHEFTRWLYEREREGRYTGLVMVWPPGYATPIHDHAGLWGIEMVLQGALAVEDYELAGDDDPQPFYLGRTVLDEGQACSFRGTDGHAHRCANLSERRPAVTLHVYGGLLDTYRNFEPVSPERYVVQPGVARISGQFGSLRLRSA